MTTLPQDKLLQLPARLAAHLELSEHVYEGTHCWRYRGKWESGNGYKKTKWRGTDTAVHRVMWMIFRGPICPTFVLDHKCRHRWCVNPDHLDPVTSAVNTARGLGVHTQFKKKEKRHHA